MVPGNKRILITWILREPIPQATCAALATAALTACPPAAAVNYRVDIVRCSEQASVQAPPVLLQQPVPAPDICGPADNTWQQQTQQLNVTAEVATGGEDRGPHWLIHVLSIGVVNILGLWAALKLIAWSKDNTTPVSLIRLHMGLRVEEGCKLQERLHFLRDMLRVEHGMFFTMEEAIQACCQPPKGAQLAYADIQVSQLSSKHEGYAQFKQYAAVEERVAEMEEAGHVVHGMRPEGPHHRTPLQRLLGAAETQDAEECQACVVVTLVMLARGHINIPEVAIKNRTAFKSMLQYVCGHLGAGQMLAFEMLMTPDSEKDFLSEAVLMEDYPFMVDLRTGQSIASMTDGLQAHVRQSQGDKATTEFA